MTISPSSTLKWLAVVLSIALAGIFSWGLVAGLRGDVGQPVGELPAPEGNAGQLRGEVVTEWRIALLGDSLARGTGDVSGKGIGGNLREMLASRGATVDWVLNLGVNGSKTADLQARLGSASAGSLAEANLIVVSIGANDVFSESRGSRAELVEIDPEVIVSRVEAVVGEIRRVNPRARLFVIGLYNPFQQTEQSGTIDGAVARWNAMLATRLSKHRAVIVPTADLFVLADRLGADRFHPSEEGYELISARILAAMGGSSLG